MDATGQPAGEQPTPKRDFGKMFDFGRTTLIKTMVDRMEQCMRDKQTAADELKEVVMEARGSEFPPRDIIAMKKIAKLRLDDKKADAQEQLAALERIGKAVGFDLFDWSKK